MLVMNHYKWQYLILNGVLGLAGENREAADLVKKYLFQRHQ